MVTALVGTNWFALKQKLDALTLEFIRKNGEYDFHKIYAPEAEYADVSSVLDAVSLFVTEKMVVLTDASKNKVIGDRAEELIQKAGEQTHLIFVENSIDKRSAFYKLLKKQPGFEEFKDLNEDQLVRWIVKYVQSAGGTISTSDARLIIQRIGANQTSIERELAKLLLYDPNITNAGIDELTDQTPASTIFNLVDNVFSGNLSGALKLYDEQRSMRVEPQAIFGMFVWQMHLVALCAAAGQKDSRTLAGETGISPYSLGKAQVIARKMGVKKITEFIDLLRDIERTSKSQTYSLDEALRFAIVSLAK